MAANPGKSKSGPRRKLTSWIGSFLDYTESLPTTPTFRTWSGIAAVSAALQRNVFTVIGDKPLYPNMYLLLVSPPGVGKSVAATEAMHLIDQIKEIKTAPEGTTRQHLLDLIEEAYNLTTYKGKPIEQSSVYGFLDEFAVFLKRNDPDFMADLAKLFDGPKKFRTGTRHNGTVYAINPGFGFIGGVTPVWVKDAFTEDAFESGFPARVVMIWDDVESSLALFEPMPGRPAMAKELLLDLRLINSIKGEYKWEPAAAKELQLWVNNGMLPKVEDPKFIHYNRRRVIQVIKLCMIFAASKRQELIITSEDYEDAKMLLLNAEERMHVVGEAMGGNPYKHQVDLVYQMVEAHFHRTQDGMPEYRIRQRLSREVPLHFIESIINNMIAMRLLHHGKDEESPRRDLFPGKKVGRATISELSRTPVSATTARQNHPSQPIRAEDTGSAGNPEKPN